MRRLLRTVTTVVFLAAAGALPTAAADDAAARNSLAIGINAYRQGSLEAAIEALSEALQGPLSSRPAAKALYYRGLAYRAVGRPGQAVADLDAAIALRNGLSLGQLADAEDNRAAAQREAGIGAGQSVVPAQPEKRLQISDRTPQSFLTTTSIDPAEPEDSAWAAAMVLPPLPETHGAPFATEVMTAAAPQTAVTAAPQTAAAAAPRSDTTGGIRVQVARVQTQSEAYGLGVGGGYGAASSPRNAWGALCHRGDDGCRSADRSGGRSAVRHHGRHPRAGCAGADAERGLCARRAPHLPARR